MRELYLIVILLFLLSACKKFEPAEEAFFVRASSVSVKTNPNQGSGSHKITDFWLYVNGQFQGCYPVGNRMPIVSKGGQVKLSLQAGIKNNGISDTRMVWPFYQTLELDTFIDSGKNIDHNFTFQYKSATAFTLNETFDAAGIGIVKSAVSDGEYKIVDKGPESLEGRCCSIALTGGQIIGQVESSLSFALPPNSPDVYLELNYKGNEEFVCGLIGGNGELKPTLVIKPQENWNKIYVQLATTVNMEPIYKVYKLYFRMLKREVADPKIFLDNIKLVHFQ